MNVQLDGCMKLRRLLMVTMSWFVVELGYAKKMVWELIELQLIFTVLMRHAMLGENI